MTEEKEILTAENDRLSEESVWLVYLVSVVFNQIDVYYCFLKDQLKAYFEKLIGSVQNGEGDQYEGIQ